MERSRKLWITIFVLGVVGAGLFVALLVRSNLGAIAETIAKMGWAVALVVAAHLLPIIANAGAWWSLFPRDKRPKFPMLTWIRWIGESVQNLLPATAVGGEIVRARIAALRGSAVSMSAATVIVDITLGIFAQIAFTLSGVYLLAKLTGRSGMVFQAVAGSLIAAVAIVLFCVVQRFGMFRILNAIVSKIVNPDAFRSLSQHGESLDDDVRSIYARPSALVNSFIWSLINWAVGMIEVWIALLALGVSESFSRAWVLESLQQGVRAAVFLIPGGLGFQEGGYVVVGGMLGIPADVAMALALVRRVRELAFGIPGLLAWQWVEGNRLWSKTNRARAALTPLTPSPGTPGEGGGEGSAG